ncbi:hypothetical protein N0V93_009544 [Gnomoniopsis smithogilvyi]|uniref:Uncharacterized protein n=1 Tax=Gnomoniopsis smithogilvyi TaxID=1191159 RepID=A0A9W8YKQ0_9PEZI|nr:hypothetical protein N0V93_009544 [Gnomoniopsis smithogilvyi]
MTPDGVQPGQQASHTNHDPQVTTESQKFQVPRPNTRPTTSKGSGHAKPETSSKIRTRPGRTTTKSSLHPNEGISTSLFTSTASIKSSPQPYNQLTESSFTSTFPSACPTPPPGFNVVCGQKPGPDSVVERTLRKRATKGWCNKEWKRYYKRVHSTSKDRIYRGGLRPHAKQPFGLATV